MKNIRNTPRILTLGGATCLAILCIGTAQAQRGPGRGPNGRQGPPPFLQSIGERFAVVAQADTNNDQQIDADEQVALAAGIESGEFAMPERGPRSPRGEQADRPQRGPRGERFQRPQRGPAGGQAQRPQRGPDSERGQRPQRPEGARGERPEPSAEHLAERMAAVYNTFAKYDADGNGALNEEEVQSLMDAIRNGDVEPPRVPGRPGYGEEEDTRRPQRDRAAPQSRGEDRGPRGPRGPRGGRQ